MGMAIAPVLDSEIERVKEQLATAAALRKAGMSGNTGAGMVGQVYAVGNPWGNIAQSLAGALLGHKARNAEADIEQRQLQERNDWLSQMPSGTETVPQAGPVQEGEAPLPDVERQASPRALAQATQAWAMKAPRGMEGVQNFALQQAMTAPQRQAEAEQRAADRMQELQLKMMDIRATAAERFAAQKEIAQMQIDAKKDMVHLAAALRPAPAPHTSIAYGPDGKGYLVDMRTGAQSPLENIGKVPGASGAGVKLPIQAQKMQSSLQNLESGLNAYEKLLKQYNPQSGDALTPEKRAAIATAFGDLRMQLKGAYELGAITGPDMQVLEGVLTDPTGPLGMAKGAIRGTKTFDAQISQTRAALERQKRNFEQQYGLTLPDPAGSATAPMPGATANGFKILGVRDK